MFINAGRNLVSDSSPCARVRTARSHTILSGGLPPPPAFGVAGSGHLPQGVDADPSGEQGTKIIYNVICVKNQQDAQFFSSMI